MRIPPGALPETEVCQKLLARAWRSLLADAEAEAQTKGIPLDGSWRFIYWTETTTSEAGSTVFRVSGRWQPTSKAAA